MLYDRRMTIRLNWRRKFVARRSAAIRNVLVKSLRPRPSDPPCRQPKDGFAGERYRRLEPMELTPGEWFCPITGEIL